MPLMHETQANIIEALNSKPRYLDDLLDIESKWFEEIVDTIPKYYS